MSGPSQRFAGVVLLSAVLATPAVAIAAVTIRPPVGWVVDTGGEAEARVQSWLASQPNARVVRVYTTAGRDAFAETLALVELPGVLDAASSDATEIDRALTGMPGFHSTAATIARSDTSVEPRIVARWQHDDIAYRAELVASGETRTLLVAATLASEAVLYDRVLDEASASLEGAELPRTPFDRSAWRLRTLVTGVVVFAALVGIAMWRRPFGARARDVGRIAAIVIVVVSLVGAQLTSSAMAEHVDALRLAGLTSGTLVAEVAAWGLLSAILVWALGLWIGRDEGLVASAPPRGAFADRSSAVLVSVPMIPKVPPRSATARRHPDGPSQLETATPTPPANPPG